MIPQGWQEKTLGEVCIVERGSSPRPIKNFITNDGSGVNWIKIGDCSGKYVTSTAQKITEEGAKKSRHVKEGDFVISNSMSYGKPYILKIDGYIHDGWFVLRLNKNLVNADYFYYLLSSNYVKEQYDALATGAIVQNISSDLIKRVQFNLPPLSEQERIVAKLDEAFEAIDKVKANAEQNLTNAKELFESALNKSFTENTEGWEEKNLKNVSNSIQYGYTESANYKKVGPKFLRITDIQDNNVSWVDVPYCVIDDDNRKKYVLKNGDIVFARTGATVGKSYLIENLEEDAVYASYLIRVSINRDLLIPKFVKHFFESKLYWNQIIDKQTGAGQPNVNGTKLGQIVLSYPKIEEQQKIVEKLDALQEQTKQLEAIYTKKIKDLDELKQSILQKAFRGEL